MVVAVIGICEDEKKKKRRAVEDGRRQSQVSSAAPSDVVILSMSKPETYVESSSRNKEMQGYHREST